MTAALDRTQNSNRFAAHIVKTTVESTLEAVADVLDIPEVKDLKLKCSQRTVGSKREKNRTEIADEARHILDSTPGPLSLHWDGKLLPDDPAGKRAINIACILKSILRVTYHFSFF